MAELTHIEIGVRDLDRSTEFYSGLLTFPPAETSTDHAGHRVQTLGTGPGVIRLVEVGDGLPNNWQRDDLQLGIRHFGMKVADVDGWSARLAKAGVPFAAEPFDAFGGVRISFFFDPDGAYLEFVQGYVQHNNLFSAQLAQAEIDADRDWDGHPRFDHVAVTVPDLAEALAYYADGLGFDRIGQLVRPEDERGFLITNLRAGPGVLEVFTYGEPTHHRDGVGEPDRLGLRAIGVSTDRTEVGPGDVPVKGS
ncbi:VOC family protein [Fodinicola acaciae]|uniref:VOC family protein n=1 Tax=Fodinicola acaciae TaxID=2681555 RepID=UPI0013D66AD7|nr:VOC family protein [Fodinicola acaciae]